MSLDVGQRGTSQNVGHRIRVACMHGIDRHPIDPLLGLCKMPQENIFVEMHELEPGLFGNFVHVAQITTRWGGQEGNLINPYTTKFQASLQDPMLTHRLHATYRKLSERPCACFASMPFQNSSTCAGWSDFVNFARNCLGLSPSRSSDDMMPITDGEVQTLPLNRSWRFAIQGVRRDVYVSTYRDLSVYHSPTCAVHDLLHELRSSSWLHADNSQLRPASGS